MEFTIAIFHIRTMYGTQGDIWNAKKDIFLAFSGAILATTIVTLIKRHFKFTKMKITLNNIIFY